MRNPILQALCLGDFYSPGISHAAVPANKGFGQRLQ